MQKFTTRIELRGANWDDYVLLHSEMRKRGFSQTIVAGDGKVYDLPDAEYNYEGNITRDEVFKKAKAAADAVKHSSGILVTESAGRSWDGLKLARAAA